MALALRDIEIGPIAGESGRHHAEALYSPSRATTERSNLVWYLSFAASGLKNRPKSGAIPHEARLETSQQ
jgi:hypothetical protein